MLLFCILSCLKHSHARASTCTNHIRINHCRIRVEIRVVAKRAASVLDATFCRFCETESPCPHELCECH